MEPLQECAFCGDELSPENAIKMPCNLHVLDAECLRERFEAALKSESMYPPNCCGVDFPITFHYVQQLNLDTFDTAFRDAYAEKLMEYNVAPKLRVYCANLECAKFLNPDGYTKDFREVTRCYCFYCGSISCINCKKLWNADERHICETDQAEAEIEYGPDQRVKRCPQCATLVLLQDLCNHVICPNCGFLFCFICLRPLLGHATQLFPCVRYGDPEYDGETRDGYGFHRDTGLDREGYDRAGFNRVGVDREGILRAERAPLRHHYLNNFETSSEFRSKHGAGDESQEGPGEEVADDPDDESDHGLAEEL